MSMLIIILKCLKRATSQGIIGSETETTDNLKLEQELAGYLIPTYCLRPDFNRLRLERIQSTL